MKRGPLACLVAGIVVLVGGPLVGLLRTVLGMVRAFNDTAQQGTASPQSLAGHIHVALLETVAALPVAAAGLALVIVALVLHLAGRERRPQDEEA
ncbi:MAG: MotA/TolQ/ExbB proton channel family protein [Planctomycetota bacterium]